MKKKVREVTMDVKGKVVNIGIDVHKIFRQRTEAGFADQGGFDRSASSSLDYHDRVSTLRNS
jgi:hypothetical protein